MPFSNSQACNQRKARLGAFREDRYYVTAIETNARLHRCLVCIAMKMVQAGVVAHADEWPHGGYREIPQPPQRYRIIDLALSELCGFDDVDQFQRAHRKWVFSTLPAPASEREAHWTESIAVGSESSVEQVKIDLDLNAPSSDFRR